jgi:putative phage-type endonuclease
MLEQRSKEWFDIRLGKFTASRINELLGKTGLNKTGATYCFEKATELVYGKNEEEDFTSYDMQRGITLEPLAFRKFKDIKEMDFIEVKEAYFSPYGKHSGASPDGLVGKDAVLEIKCPRSTKFFSLVKDGLKAIDADYFAQMQMQMLCTNSVRAHFFNYLIFNGQEMWHEIVVDRDEVIIDLIKKRIDEAIELRNQYAKELMQNQQF